MFEDTSLFSVLLRGTISEVEMMAGSSDVFAGLRPLSNTFLELPGRVSMVLAALEVVSK